jgi:hypothetical protein
MLERERQLLEAAGKDATKATVSVVTLTATVVKVAESLIEMARDMFETSDSPKVRLALFTAASNIRAAVISGVSELIPGFDMDRLNLDFDADRDEDN